MSIPGRHPRQAVAGAARHRRRRAARGLRDRRSLARAPSRRRRSSTSSRATPRCWRSTTRRWRRRTTSRLDELRRRRRLRLQLARRRLRRRRRRPSRRTLLSLADSSAVGGSEIERDPTALEAATNVRTVRARVRHDGREYAEVAVPLAHRRRRDAPLELALRPARDRRARQAAAPLRDRRRAADRASCSASRSRRSTRAGSAGCSGPPTGSPRARSTSRWSTTSADEVGQLAALVRPDAPPARPARPRPQGVRRERLARAADAAVLDRRLPRAPRRRGSRREHAAGVPRDDAEPGRPPDEPRDRPARPLPDGRRPDPDRARGGRAGRGRAPGGGGLRRPRRRLGPHARCVDVDDDAWAFADEERVQQIARALAGQRARPHARRARRCGSGSSGAASASRWPSRTTAPGIPPEHLDRIFQRFYRVEGGQASGSGLGLAIARELAGRMGGTVTVASRPGATAFTLELPAEERGACGSDRARCRGLSVAAVSTWKRCAGRAVASEARGYSDARAPPGLRHRRRRRDSRRRLSPSRSASLTGLTDGGTTTVVVERTGPADGRSAARHACRSSATASTRRRSTRAGRPAS